MNAVLNLKQDGAADTVTIITHVNQTCRLAKTWKADGTIKGYDNAGQFKWREVAVRSLEGFKRLMESKLIDDPYSCINRAIVRDECRGEDVIRRDSAHMRPQKMHLFAVDVDKFVPITVDVAEDPQGAIEEYIQDELPSAFWGASYVWHLSASMGHQSAEDVLKCHLFFWLEEPQYGAVLREWIKRNKLEIDPSMTKDVQPIYTANPVFERGVVDPLEGSRLGYVAKDSHSVRIDFDEQLVEDALTAQAGEFSLVDPKEKLGLIGQFCRAFTMEEVVDRWLSDVFDVSAWPRLTFLLGGGAAEGAWVTSCGEYIGNSHASDPMGGRLANKWDLVRVYVFGNLDEGLSDLRLANVAGLPSQEAMINMVEGLEEIRDEKLAGFKKLEKMVADAEDAESLGGEVCAAIRRDFELTAMQREQLAQQIRGRMAELGAGRMPIGTVRAELRPRRESGDSDGERRLPSWVEGVYFLRDADKFYRAETGDHWTTSSFNHEYNRELGPGRETTAAAWVTDNGWVPVVRQVMYVPFLDEVFSLDGVQYVNGFVPATIPEARDMGEEGWKRVELFKKHMLLFCNGRQEIVDIIVKWMAHNVQHPGKKIIWAPLLKGCPGDGKTLIRSILSAAMGGTHVGEVSSAVLHTDFNSFAHGKSVVVLEEVRASGKNRHDVLDKLKPLVTNQRITVHRKKENEFDAINTTNYIAFTNHSDALPVDNSDRRWMVVFSPYLHLSELAEDVGDTFKYFEPLHELYRHYGAHCRHWLLNESLEGFKAVGVAPVTEEREDLIEIARAEVEDVIVEIVGDMNVINSRWLTLMVEKHESRVTLSRKFLPKYLEKMGFRRWHKQFWLDGKNVTVYGKSRNVLARQEILEKLSTFGQIEDPKPF